MRNGDWHQVLSTEKSVWKLLTFDLLHFGIPEIKKKKLKKISRIALVCNLETWICLKKRSDTECEFYKQYRFQLVKIITFHLTVDKPCRVLPINGTNESIPALERSGSLIFFSRRNFSLRGWSGTSTCVAFRKNKNVLLSLCVCLRICTWGFSHCLLCDTSANPTPQQRHRVLPRIWILLFRILWRPDSHANVCVCFYFPACCRSLLLFSFFHINSVFADSWLWDCLVFSLLSIRRGSSRFAFSGGTCSSACLTKGHNFPNP